MADFGARQRVKRAQAKIGKLIKKGVPFNISRVSGSTLQTATTAAPTAGVRKQAGKEFEARTVAQTPNLGPTPRFDNEQVRGGKTGGFR